MRNTATIARSVYIFGSQGYRVRSGSGCGEEKTRCGEEETGCGEGETGCGEEETGCGEEETGCGEGETGCGEEKVYFGATVIWSFLGRAPLGNCPQSEDGREPQMPVGPHVSLPRKRDTCGPGDLDF